jgi:hypothetical protein
MESASTAGFPVAFCEALAFTDWASFSPVVE